MNLGFIDESRYSLLDIRYSLLDIRLFFFVPETLNPIFLGKSKKTRAGKWSRSVFSKVNLEPYDAIWCQFGSQISSPKTRVYEYNQLIFSILTVFFFLKFQELGQLHKNRHFLTKWLPFFVLFWAFSFDFRCLLPTCGSICHFFCISIYPF